MLITFFIDCGDLDYCDNCLAPDSRKYEFSSKDAFDPVRLFTPEEHRLLDPVKSVPKHLRGTRLESELGL